MLCAANPVIHTKYRQRFPSFVKKMSKQMLLKSNKTLNVSLSMYIHLHNIYNPDPCHYPNPPPDRPAPRFMKISKSWSKPKKFPQTGSAPKPMYIHN